MGLGKSTRLDRKYSKVISLHYSSLDPLMPANLQFEACCKAGEAGKLGIRGQRCVILSGRDNMHG